MIEEASEAGRLSYPWSPMVTRHPMWPDVSDLSKERDVLLAHASRLNASFDPLRRAFAEAYGIEPCRAEHGILLRLWHWVKGLAR